MPDEEQFAQERIGLGDVVGALQRQLSWLAATTGVDSLAIALVFRDVAAYLDDRRIRDDVLECVLDTMPDSGDVVLVSHSLGTVVGMDLATRLPAGVNLVHLTTTGSPLGLDSVYGRLLIGGPNRPDKVADWLNAWSPNDGVAIGCPLGDDWKDGVVDMAVLNARDRAHSITEYLSHAEVARGIGGPLAL